MSNSQLNNCGPILTDNKESLKIFKFGGSCFKDEDSFNQCIRIIELHKKSRIICVCSALFGITNKLIEFGKSVFEPGLVENAPELILNEISTAHIGYVDTLMKVNPQLHEKMMSFIHEKIQQLRDFMPELKENGMIPKNSDFVVSFGERMSAYLFAEYLLAKGYDSDFVPTDEDLLITNEDYGNALPILPLCEEKMRHKLIPLLNSNHVVVLPGFYGATENKDISTLGRGGTDFTTTIVGYTLANDYNVDVVFWKDVYGILSANPKYMPSAKLLKTLSYKEAKELAYFGTNILHPLCLKTAEQRNVTAEIRNFLDPVSEQFTAITRECVVPRRSNEIIKGITSLDRIAMVTVESDAMISLPGSAAKIFTIMGQYNINVNFISQCSSENNITFGTHLENGIKAKKVLTQNEYFGRHWFNVKVEDDCALLSVVGAGMVHKPGIAGLLFTALGNAGVNIRAISQGSSELNITFVVSQSDLKRAVTTIYDAFIEGNIPQKISQW